MASPRMRFFMIAFAAALFFVSSYASSTQKKGDHHHETNKFSYAGVTGPYRWGRLDPTYSMCSKGKSQSPINIEKSKAVINKKLRPLIRSYKSTNVTLVNNGFNIGIHYPENSGGMIVDGKMYSLIQMHWHVPSEHRINGKQYAAELHLVHITKEGHNVTVLAILYQLGQPDPVIAKIQNQLKKLEYKSKVLDDSPVEIGTFDPKELRKKSHKYYRYIGSFTTPPCTERVVWTVLDKVRSISAQQVEALKAPVDFRCKKNARPCQPMNGRHVEVYEQEPSS